MAKDKKPKEKQIKQKWLDMYKYLVLFAKYEILPNMEKDIIEKLKNENELLKEQNKQLREDLREFYKTNHTLVDRQNKQSNSNFLMLNAQQLKILELERQLREVKK